MNNNTNRVIAGIAHPQVEDALETRTAAGAHFDPAAMCNYCRQVAAGDESQDLGDNVVGIFSTCRRGNGCMVCAFCGFAMLDSFAEHCASGTGSRECPKCGAVAVSAASRFMEDVDERAKECRRAWVEWQRRIRCLELFGMAAGVAVFHARVQGAPLAEEDIEQFFGSALAVLRLDETEECVNRFFDRLRDAIALADELSLPAPGPVLKIAARDATEAPDELTVGRAA
ncbi:MAG TPA: hypothetical protein VF215_07145 [Thermoanaerobaculia bacterium]